MAAYLPIRAISRSQSVRVGSQKALVDSTIYVDVTDGKVKRDLQHHAAIGAFLVVGPITEDTGDVIVDWGLQTTQGVSGADLIITTEAGELVNRQTGDKVDVDSTDLTLSDADATNPRIDIVQVHTGTGVVTKKDGTAAATPSQPAPDASNLLIAAVSVPANDTAITNSQITDLRPN
jgi:hypothetical protein